MPALLNKISFHCVIQGLWREWPSWEAGTVYVTNSKEVERKGRGKRRKLIGKSLI